MVIIRIRASVTVTSSPLTSFQSVCVPFSDSLEVLHCQSYWMFLKVLECNVLSFGSWLWGFNSLSVWDGGTVLFSFSDLLEVLHYHDRRVHCSLFWLMTGRLILVCLWKHHRDCARRLMSFHALAPESKQKAVYRKYSNPKLGAVSLYSPAKKLLSVWAEAPCCGGCFWWYPLLLSLWRCCYCYCVSSFWWYHFVSVLFSALCFDQYT